MFYQVKANLFFKERDEAVDFYHDCEIAFNKAASVNLEQDNAEYSIIELIHNRHDEDPYQPCALETMATQEPNL